MKKNIVLAMTTAAVIAALTGCGSSKTTETTAATTTAAETTTADATTAAESKEADKTDAAAAAEGSLKALENVDPNGHLGKVLAAGKITMGTSPDFAPWEFKDVSSGTTEYVGADVELAKYIAEKLGVELEIKPMEFSAIQQAVTSGNIDMGISGFAYTDERAEAMGLSERYNVNTKKGQGLLVKKELASQYNTAESFAGKKVATQNATLQNKLATEQLPSDVQIQLVTNITDGVMMLTTGKVDALAVSGDNGESLAKTYDDIAMADFMFDYSSEGNVIAVKKGDDDLLNAINEVIVEVNEKGLYEQWREEAVAHRDALISERIVSFCDGRSAQDGIGYRFRLQKIQSSVFPVKMPERPLSVFKFYLRKEFSRWSFLTSC